MNYGYFLGWKLPHAISRSESSKLFRIFQSSGTHGFSWLFVAPNAGCFGDFDPWDQRGSFRGRVELSPDYMNGKTITLRIPKDSPMEGLEPVWRRGQGPQNGHLWGFRILRVHQVSSQIIVLHSFNWIFCCFYILHLQVFSHQFQAISGVRGHFNDPWRFHRKFFGPGRL